MNDRQNTDRDTTVPDGINFLHDVLHFASQCERSTDVYLAFASQAPQDSMQTPECLGTLLSLLDRASSCYWGCHQADHTAEYLVGRCCSYGLCAFKLARSGFYDESIALARIIGEITNLAFLFFTDASALQDWATADDRTRKSKYCPVAVRRAIEGKQLPIPVDQHRYGSLSEKAVHLTPTIPPQMYNTARHPKTGGHFQEVGLLFCLFEIGYPLSVLGPCTVQLCNLQAEQGDSVLRAADALSKSLHSTKKRINTLFPGTYS